MKMIDLPWSTRLRTTAKKSSTSPGRQHGGRLVEDQDVGLAEQRLDELDALLLADGEVADLGVGVDEQAVLLPSSRIRRRASLMSSSPRLASSLPRIMFSATVNTGISWKCWWTMPMPWAMASLTPWKLDLLAADADRALVGLVEAEHDVHQRALAGAVLAEQAVDLALVERQVDVLVGDDAGERLGDAADLEHRGRCVTVAGHDPPLSPRHGREPRRSSTGANVNRSAADRSASGPVAASAAPGPTSCSPVPSAERQSQAEPSPRNRPSMPQMPVVMLPSARPARAASTAVVTSAGRSASCGSA